MDISAFCNDNIFTASFLAGQIGEQLANFSYDLKLGDLSKRLRDILLHGADDQNHDLLRALLYAQCHALMAVCDTCLIEDYATEPALCRELALTVGTPVSRNPEIAVIARLRHNLAATARSVQTISIVELVALVGPALDDVPGLLALGREINACENNLPALRKLALERTRNMLQFSAADRSWWQSGKAWFGSAATEPTLPANLTQRFEQHWPNFLRVTFRETLKGDQFPKARRAFELDVLSALAGVPHTLAEIETRLSRQELMLNDVYGLLFNFYDEWNTQRATAFDLAQFKTAFAAWQTQLDNIEMQATQAAENSAATLNEVLSLRSEIKQGGLVSVSLSPTDWKAYHQARVQHWSDRDWQLHRRFVRLTLQLAYEDKDGNQEFRDESQHQTYQGLDELLKARPEFPVLLVLGVPGCGKSTLLRHLQLVHSEARCQDGDQEITLLLSLNRFKGNGQTPRAWLAEQWKNNFKHLPPLEAVLQTQRVLFLLDALNEMKPAAQLDDMFADWRDEVKTLVTLGHRVVLTCRADDVRLNFQDAQDKPAPQVLTSLLKPEQMREFINLYAPEYAATIWAELDANDALQRFYQNPFFLDLLCKVIKRKKGVFPQGRASLFTEYVWVALQREFERRPEQFTQNGLLHRRDQDLLTSQHKSSVSEFALPEHGLLIPKLRDLATAMHQQGGETSLNHDEAVQKLADDAHADLILEMGVSLNLLDKSEDWHYKFYHHQLQEYFAARQFALTPDWPLLQQDWSAESYRAEFAALPKGAALPALKQSHWVETAIIAAPMAKQPNEFIRQLQTVNPVLAARCALSAEIKLDPALKAELQTVLRSMLLDQTIDVRARIAAGEQLGGLGDTRFTRHAGKEGDYLLPPFVPIKADTYTVGWRKSQYSNEQHETKVKLAAFEMAAFPVTNAEYKLFIEAGGYQNEDWWDTSDALDFLHTGAVGQRKDGWWQSRKVLQDNHWTEARLIELGEERGWNDATVEAYVKAATLSDDEFAANLDEMFAEVEPPTLPSFWEDSRFNHPSQPVVGVSWYEALAYGNWLTATVNDGRVFTLPTEAQFEAAARRKTQRLYPYGNEFDHARTNTSESRIRQTTPVGIFNNAPPEDASQGIYDLSGNVWTWTLSLYQEAAYDPFTGRDNLLQAGNRVLRGGSWNLSDVDARAIDRNYSVPASRSFNDGFRFVLMSPPS